MKFELDQTDVETILAALRERRYQLHNTTPPSVIGRVAAAINEILDIEEKIRYQQSWGVD